MKKLGFVVVALLALSACSRPGNDAPSQPSASSAPAPAPLQIITGDERKPIVDALTKGLHMNRDKMESISFYSAKNRDYLRSSIDAYFSLPDNRLPILRMRATYFGDSWVFVQSIKIMADDQVIYERTFQHGDISRDNSSGSVWEVADYHTSDADLAALKKIAAAKSATIRFSGSDRRDDHEITKKERDDIREVIATFEELTRQLQKPA